MKRKLIQERINWLTSISKKEQSRNLRPQLEEKPISSELKTAENKVEKANQKPAM